MLIKDSQSVPGLRRPTPPSTAGRKPVARPPLPIHLTPNSTQAHPAREAGGTQHKTGGARGIASQFSPAKHRAPLRVQAPTRAVQERASFDRKLQTLHARLDTVSTDKLDGKISDEF